MFGELGCDEDGAVTGELEPALGTLAPSQVGSQRNVRGAKTAAAAKDSYDEGTNDDDDNSRSKLSQTTKRKVGALAKKLPPPRPSKVAASRPPIQRKGDPAGVSRLDPSVVADNLIGVITGASLAVRTSAEEVFSELALRGWLPRSVRQCLWDAVAAGCAALHQGRVHVAVCVASAMQEIRSGTGEPAVAAARAALAVAASARPSLHAALARARSSLFVLAMVLTEDDEGDSTILANSLRSVSDVLEPPAVVSTVLETGCSLMILASNAAGIAPTHALISSLDLGGGACGDYRLAAHACDILTKLTKIALAVAKKGVNPEEDCPPIRTSKGRVKAAAALKAAEMTTTGASHCDGSGRSQECFVEIARALKGIIGMIRGDWDGGKVESIHWYAAAQHGLDAIFAVAPQPVVVCEALLRTLAEKMCTPATISVQTAIADAERDKSSLSINRASLARFFFVAGHVAMKTLLHLDVSTAASKVAAGSMDVRDTLPSASKKDSGGIEDQLGGSAVDTEIELAESIAESEILAPARSMCGLISPIVAAVVSNMLQDPVRGALDDGIAQSALMSLCKMMAISNEFAVLHCPLLFTVLGSASVGASMRSCIVIALGDLCFRFPNTVEPYTHVSISCAEMHICECRLNSTLRCSCFIQDFVIWTLACVPQLCVCSHTLC